MPSPIKSRLVRLVFVAIVALLSVTSLTYAAKHATKCTIDDDEPLVPVKNPGAVSAGCGKTPFEGEIFNVTVNGTERSYYVRVPSNYDPSRAYAVILAFHWHDGNMMDVVNKFFFYGMVLYHNESTILISPQGIDDAWENNGGEDIEFVRQILKHIESSLCVDTNRRFAMGFSYGASMAHSVACSLGDQFRAVSVQSGGEYSGCEGNGTMPVAYMITHGIRDNIIPIEKGRALRDVFAKANGCTPQTPPEPAMGDLNHIQTTYEGCSSGHPLVWTAFDDAHTAMPSDGSLMQNKTSTWEPAATWKFFAQFT